MRRFTGVLALTILAAAETSIPAQDMVFKNSGTKATLLELYSSEGCSSCPPAEEWLGTLKNSPGLWKDLFPVAFHVDYWDGLGWPDRFARAEYTERQRTYSARFGQDSVYTPEFIANGHEWRGSGHLPSQVEVAGDLSLDVRDGGKNISVSYSPPGTTAHSYTVNVAVLGFDVITDVKQGENGGRQLRHDFVVLGFDSKPMIPDSAGLLQSGTLAIAPSTNDPPAAVVAWISDSDGTLRQITGGWLKRPDGASVATK